MDGSQIRKMIFLALFLALFLLVARLFYPFLTIILWSALIYAFLDKPYEKLARKSDGSERHEGLRSIFAGTFALVGVLLIAVPAVFLGIAVLKQLGDLLTQAIRTLEKNPAYLDLSPQSPIGGFIYRLSEGSIDLSAFSINKGEVRKFLAARAGSIIGFSGTILKDALVLTLTLSFMIFTLFFFFMDVKHLARLVVRAVPIESRYSRLFLQKLRDTGQKLLKGYFLVAMFQATMMFILCLFFKVPGALVVACVTAIASFVPMVGTSLVWLPVSLGFVLGGQVV
jgi:predicted PurR-regulated permease PerM